MAKQNKGTETAPENQTIENAPANTDNGNGVNVDTETGEIIDPAAELQKAKEEKPEPRPATKPKMRTLISGAEFWKFSDEYDDKGTKVVDADGAIFEGYFKAEQKREKDGKGADQKAGSVIGYVFSQAGTDEQYLIGKSHSIEKALTSAGFPKDKLFKFEFLGKGTNSSGQPFNRFEIQVEE
jgi:hypothetical protein